MKTLSRFVAKFTSSIVAVLSCLDRVIFKGHLALAAPRELEYFVDCVLNSRRPLNDGVAGLRVVKLLEAADASLQKRGRIVFV